MIHWMLIFFLDLDDLFLSSNSVDTIQKKFFTTHKLVVKPVQQAPDLSEDVGQIVELPTPMKKLNQKMLIIWPNLIILLRRNTC